MATTAVKERPINLRRDEVRSILCGRKTLHLLPVRIPRWARGHEWHLDEFGFLSSFCSAINTEAWINCPLATTKVDWLPDGPAISGHYEPTCSLLVREPWCPIPSEKPSGYFTDPKWIGRTAWYSADNDKPTWGGAWVSASRMPLDVCRLRLEITKILAVRLKDLTEDDADDTGVMDAVWARDGRANDIDMENWCRYSKVIDPKARVASSRGALATVWQRTKKYGEYSWDRNPWVWAITFRVLSQ